MERKTAGIPVEERMIIPPTEILAKARVNTQAKEKANTWTLSKQNNLNFLKQPQPCRILRKLVPSICFLTVAHSFTPVQSRIQDIRYRCLILESTQQVEQDSNMTEDDW